MPCGRLSGPRDASRSRTTLTKSIRSSFNCSRAGGGSPGWAARARRPLYRAASASSSAASFPASAAALNAEAAARARCAAAATSIEARCAAIIVGGAEQSHSATGKASKSASICAEASVMRPTPSRVASSLGSHQVVPMQLKDPRGSVLEVSWCESRIKRPFHTCRTSKLKLRSTGVLSFSSRYDRVPEGHASYALRLQYVYGCMYLQLLLPRDAYLVARRAAALQLNNSNPKQPTLECMPRAQRRTLCIALTAARRPYPRHHPRYPRHRRHQPVRWMRCMPEAVSMMSESWPSSSSSTAASNSGCM